MRTTPRRPTPDQPSSLAPTRGIHDSESQDDSGPANPTPRDEPPHDAAPPSSGTPAVGDAGGSRTDRPPPPPPPAPPSGGGTSDSPLVVALTRPDDPALEHYEVALWQVIAATSHATSFGVLAHFLDGFFDNQTEHDHDSKFWRTKRNSVIRRTVSPYGLDAWELVAGATEIFLKHQAGALSDIDYLANPPSVRESQTLPYTDNRAKEEFELMLAKRLASKPRLSTYLELVSQKLRELPLLPYYSLSVDQEGIFQDRIDSPLLIELIWSYWMEQGMLVQTMNAISLRFQNAEVPELKDSLRNLAIDPLRALSNLLWGYVQYESDRLSVARRAAEYMNIYGLDLIGKIVKKLHVVERRSRFLEAFHTLLHTCTAFYKEHDDLTVKADGFPLLNAITEVHLLLAEGAYNQFSDLPWTARSEMMAMQWLLARPEFREFLGGRIMVPYPEPWMDRVDTMKTLQGWTDVSITSFYWLATYGEQILLSIRYGNWSIIADAALAGKWAEQWRPAVQSYVHHYRQVTGVDLAVAPTDIRDGAERFLQPSLLMAHRAQQPPRSDRQRPAALARPQPPNQIGLPRRPVLPAQRG